MHFEYSFKKTYDADIDIEDYGNVCIHAIKETLFGYADWFMIINTDCGYSDIEWFGPFKDISTSNDIDTGSFHYNWIHVECKEKDMFRIIDNFISKTGGDSFQVEEFDKNTAYDLLDDATYQVRNKRNYSI